MSGIIWGPQHPDTKAALADINRRLEALEKRQGVPWPFDLALAHDDNQCACGDAHVDTCQGCAVDPAPVPEWRRLADAGVRNLTKEDPLVVVLRSLSNVADPQKVTTANLARIVAVCEAQVGDGWQADPDLWTKPKGSGSVWGLLTAFSYDSPVGPNETDWRCLGQSAARWLRDLTEDAS